MRPEADSRGTGRRYRLSSKRARAGNELATLRAREVIPVQRCRRRGPVGVADRHGVEARHRGDVAGGDVARSQVTVAAGNQQLLLQLPPSVVRDLRPGDRISLDVSVEPAR
jgi:hypothetical protein